MKVVLFKFCEVAEVDFPLDELVQFIGNWVLLQVNGELLVKTAQAQDPNGGYFLLVRPIVEIPGKLEGEQAVEEEKIAARDAGVGWIDRRDQPLQVTWKERRGVL